MKYLIRSTLLGAACVAAPLSSLWAEEPDFKVFKEPTVLTCHDGGLEFQLNHLFEEFGEEIIFEGLSSDGSMSYVTVSDSGEWTIFFHRPDGVVCALLVGDGYIESAAWDMIKKGDPT